MGVVDRGPTVEHTVSLAGHSRHCFNHSGLLSVKPVFKPTDTDHEYQPTLSVEKRQCERCEAFYVFADTACVTSSSRT